MSCLGPSWSPFWNHLGQLRTILGSSGPSWGYLGAVLDCLGPSWAILGPILGPSWAILGPSWVLRGHLRGYLGAVLGCLGPSWAILGPNLTPLALVLGRPKEGALPIWRPKKEVSVSLRVRVLCSSRAMSRTGKLMVKVLLIEYTSHLLGSENRWLPSSEYNAPGRMDHLQGNSEFHILGHLKTILGSSGASWGYVGAVLGCLGPSWAILGAILRPSWAILGPSWALRGHLGVILGLSWTVWGHLEAILGHLGRILGPRAF